ncbi:MAG: mucoidy inhibitor MuiA family protein [Bradymonadia bacterium]
MTSEHVFPPLEEGRVLLDLPVVEVTLLEDRAQVIRRGMVALTVGAHKLAIAGVAPVAQDVSVRGGLSGPGNGRVSDTRLVRARRPHLQDPEGERALRIAEHTRQLEALRGQQIALTESRLWSQGQMQMVDEMLDHSAAELSGDVAWGRHDPDRWNEVFDGLFDQLGTLESEDLEGFFKGIELHKDIERHITALTTLNDARATLVARVELDLTVESDGLYQVEVAYVVPCALWRPCHRARLIEGPDSAQLQFSCDATLWQHTGEDWANATLKFSTARSSTAHEPPLLSDDLLNAQRKGSPPPLETREVEVQTTGPTGKGGAMPRSVELPGVDDGGEVRTLQAAEPVTVPSNGRPVRVPLFSFTSAAHCEWRLMAEIDTGAHLAVTAHHSGAHPILAGPVELIREGGIVGESTVLFVAPGAPMELGFGPAPDVQVVRKVTVKSDTDPVDKWVHKDHRLVLYLSNYGPEERCLHVTERVPVSEVPEVKVQMLNASADGKSVGIEVDDQGMWTTTHTLPPYSQSEIKLKWRLSTHE